MTTAVAVQPRIGKDDLAFIAVGGSLSNLLDKLASVEPPKAVDKASMPEVVELPTVLSMALERIPLVFNSVRPAKRRKLNRVELKALADERQTIDSVIKILNDRKAQITEIASTHFDVKAENLGLATDDTERDKDGHYRIAFPGNREEDTLRDDHRMWVREGTSDSSEISSSRLELFAKQGRIPSAIYRAMTVEARIVNEDRIRAALVNPKTRRGVLNALSMITVTKKGVNRVTLRHEKNRTK